MKEAVIVSACRTAAGKAPRGMLKDTRPEEMGAAVLADLIKRAGDMDPGLIDDVIIGCTFPEATQGLNLGRVLVMSLGWPDRIPGMTVNRFCSSGLQAIAIGAEKIMCGFSDVVIAGGVENMSQIPMGGSMLYPNPASNLLYVIAPDNYSFEIYSVIGAKMIDTKNKHIDISY